MFTVHVTCIELLQANHVLCVYVTGIELSQDNPEEVWSVKVDPEEEDDDQGPDRDFMIHQLYVKMVSPSVTDQSDAWGILSCLSFHEVPAPELSAAALL